jgi:hypothetical protein
VEVRGHIKALLGFRVLNENRGKLVKALEIA